MNGHIEYWQSGNRALAHEIDSPSKTISPFIQLDDAGGLCNQWALI